MEKTKKPWFASQIQCSDHKCTPYPCIFSNTQRNLALSQQGGHLHLRLIWICPHHHCVLQKNLPLHTDDQKKTKFLERFVTSQIFLFCMKVKKISTAQVVEVLGVKLIDSNNFGVSIFDSIPSTELHFQVETELQRLNAQHYSLVENNHAR